MEAKSLIEFAKLAAQDIRLLQDLIVCREEVIIGSWRLIILIDVTQEGEICNVREMQIIAHTIQKVLMV